MKPLLFFISLAFANTLFTQNLVLNPSFETLHPDAKPAKKTIKFQYPECGHTAHFSEFNSTVQGWSTYMPGTPDLVIYPESDSDDCLYPKPRTGNRMIGMITYHPKQDTWSEFDFHEVIQGTLRAPMHVGKTFEITFWVQSDEVTSKKHLEMVYSRETPILPCAANNLGIHFLEESVTDNKDFWDKITAGEVKPHLIEKEIIQTKNQEWQQIRFTFTADKPYQYFLVGNLLPDTETEINIAPEITEKIDKINGQKKINFWAKTKRVAYYCIDDFVITPLKNEVAQALKAAKNYTFQNVTFKSGSAELLPNSFAELDNLAQFLKENPIVKIRIEGHTDNVGNANANQILSEKRAAALVDFLKNKDIAATRLKAVGKGETAHVADNDSAAGRQQNRRVQVVLE